MSTAERRDDSQEERPHPWPEVNEDTDRPVLEHYETDGGIVLYEAENPMAWIEAETEQSFITIGSS